MNIFIQDVEQRGAAGQLFYNMLWALALLALAGYLAVWFTQEPHHLARRQRGRDPRYYAEHWVLRIIRDNIRAFGFWLAHVARPRGQPEHRRPTRARRFTRRNFLRQRRAEGEVVQPQEDEYADMPPLEDIPVRSFVDDLFVIDPLTRMTHLAPDYLNRLRARIHLEATSGEGTGEGEQ